jgi:hypothetical protein
VDRPTCPRMNGHTIDGALRIFGHMDGEHARINGHTSRPQSLCWCGFPTSTCSSLLYLMPIVGVGAQWTTRNTYAAASTEEDRTRAFDRGCGSLGRSGDGPAQARRFGLRPLLFRSSARSKMRRWVVCLEGGVSGCAPFFSVLAHGRRCEGGGVFGGWQETCLATKGVELFGGPNNFDLRRPR